MFWHSWLLSYHPNVRIKPARLKLKVRFTRKEKVTLARKVNVTLEWKWNNRAEAWATLVEKSNAFSTPIIGMEFHCVNVVEGIGADGWTAVRRVVEGISTLSVINICTVSQRKAMSAGRGEDIEAIWKVAFGFCVFSDEGSIELFKTEEGMPGWWKYGGQHHRSWTGMDQIIDVSEQEWQEKMSLFKEC